MPKNKGKGGKTGEGERMKMKDSNVSLFSKKTDKNMHR